jgi:flagella basal body P-ring formation protein FlgA
MNRSSGMLVLLLAVTTGAANTPHPTAHAAPPTAHRGAAATAAPAAVVTFRTTAVVRDRIVRLGDVAVVEGADPALIASLEAVEVGTAPLFGHTRSVTAAYAQIRIRQIGVNPARLLFAGAQLVAVTRPEQVLPGAALAKAACDAVEAANPGSTAQVTFTPGDLRLPEGPVELRPQEARLLGNTSGTLTVRVHVAGREEASATVSFRLLRRAPAVVAARDLLAGTVLSEDNLRVEERPVVPGPLVLGELSLAVGRQVTVPIRGGAALTASMVKAAVLVKRGARVKLVCRAPGFTATVGGEALQDGTAGQPVRVRNLSSLLEVTGIVVTAQTVEVPY